MSKTLLAEGDEWWDAPDEEWDRRFEAALKREWRDDRIRAFRETWRQRGLGQVALPSGETRTYSLGETSPSRARRLLVVVKTFLLMPWAGEGYPDDPDRDHHTVAAWGVSGPGYSDGSYEWSECGVPARFFARPRIWRDGS